MTLLGSSNTMGYVLGEPRQFRERAEDWCPSCEATRVTAKEYISWMWKLQRVAISYDHRGGDDIYLMPFIQSRSDFFLFAQFLALRHGLDACYDPEDNLDEMNGAVCRLSNEKNHMRCMCVCGFSERFMKEQRCPTCGIIRICSNNSIIWTPNQQSVSIRSSVQKSEEAYLMPFIQSRSDFFLFAQFLALHHGFGLHCGADDNVLGSSNVVVYDFSER